MLKMADIDERLKDDGWYFTSEGLKLCQENDNATVQTIIQKAVDLDLTNIGGAHLPDGTNRSKNLRLEGKHVLQVSRIRNVSAPKENQENEGTPPLFKASLTDGQVTCQALLMESISQFDMATPPGVKVLLHKPVDIFNGFLLLYSKNCRILGGRVEKLLENWEMKKSLAQCKREEYQGGGPPPFIPFGKKMLAAGISTKPRILMSKENFQSLKLAGKEQKNDTEFENQRQAQIEGAMQKTNHVGARKNFGHGSEKQVKRDVAIAKIVELGWKLHEAAAAYKQEGSIECAVEALINGTVDLRGQGSRQSAHSSQGDKVGRGAKRDRASEENKNGDGRGRRGGERGGERGRGRRGRGGQESSSDGYEDAGRPSGPATLFDFMSSNIPKGESVSYNGDEKLMEMVQKTQEERSDNIQFNPSRMNNLKGFGARSSESLKGKPVDHSANHWPTPPEAHYGMNVSGQASARSHEQGDHPGLMKEFSLDGQNRRDGGRFQHDRWERNSQRDRRDAKQRMNNPSVGPRLQNHFRLPRDSDRSTGRKCKPDDAEKKSFTHDFYCQGTEAGSSSSDYPALPGTSVQILKNTSRLKSALSPHSDSQHQHQRKANMPATSFTDSLMWDGSKSAPALCHSSSQQPTFAGNSYEKPHLNDGSRQKSRHEGISQKSLGASYRKANPVGTAYHGSQSSIDNFQKQSQIDNFQKQSQIDNFQKQSQVDNFQKQSQVDNFQKQSQVDKNSKLIEGCPVDSHQYSISNQASPWIFSNQAPRHSYQNQANSGNSYQNQTAAGNSYQLGNSYQKKNRSGNVYQKHAGNFQKQTPMPNSYQKPVHMNSSNNKPAPMGSSYQKPANKCQKQDSVKPELTPHQKSMQSVPVENLQKQSAIANSFQKSNQVCGSYQKPTPTSFQRHSPIKNSYPTQNPIRNSFQRQSPIASSYQSQSPIASSYQKTGVGNDISIYQNQSDLVNSNLIQVISNSSSQEFLQPATFAEAGLPSSHFGHDVSSMMQSYTWPDDVLNQISQLAISSQANNLSKDDLCIAPYYADGRLYRAVVDSVNHDGVTIRFSDYGNIETVPSAHIQLVSRQVWDNFSMFGDVQQQNLFAPATKQPYEGVIGNMEFLRH